MKISNEQSNLYLKELIFFKIQVIRRKEITHIGICINETKTKKINK